MLDDISRLITPKLSKYCPTKPTPKQLAFLLLTKNEALFGGQAGGGKSEALLMGALENTDVPGYAALLLRKTYADLKLPSAILARLLTWMAPYIRKKIVVYKPSENHTFHFPCYAKDGTRLPDATISFGYLGDVNSVMRYQGAEFQFIGIDEVCQHIETDYAYLFSRLRKKLCPIHGKSIDKKCLVCVGQQNLILKFRATANPGGIGHKWVRERFKIDKSPEYRDWNDRGHSIVDFVTKTKKPPYIGFDKDRPFIPSSLWDNPFIDQESYAESLSRMTDDHKLPLMFGDWGFTPNSRFRRDKQRFYSITGSLLFFGPNMRGRSIDLRKDIIEIFQVIDPAASSDEGPGDTQVFEVKKASSTVISTFALTTCYNLVWLHMLKFRDEIPEVISTMREQYEMWKPSKVIIESNGVGKGVVQISQRLGMVIHGINTDRDKIVNAANAIYQMNAGRIWFPQETSEWRVEAEDEVFTWQGHPLESDDIVDTLSNACNYVKWDEAPGGVEEYFQTTEVSNVHELPSYVGGLRGIGNVW